MSKEQHIAKLEHQNMMLKMDNENAFNFIDDVSTECLPIAFEIASAKGFLKVFKIIKLAIYLAKILIDAFDKKPKKQTWY